MPSVTVVSIVRLQGLVTFANSINPTWDNWSTGVWSTIEINIGIICACMPSLRLLLVRLFPKVLGTNNTPPSGSGQDSRTNGRRHATVSMNGKSSKVGILDSRSYTVQRGTGSDDDKEHLVKLEDVSSEFMKLRARGSDMWGGEGLYNSGEAKSVGRRLSSNFTPAP